MSRARVVADIYAARAGYSDDDRRAVLLGWEYGANLARAPVRDFGRGIVNHHIHRDKLRGMGELGHRIMRLTARAARELPPDPSLSRSRP